MSFFHWKEKFKAALGYIGHLCGECKYFVFTVPLKSGFIFVSVRDRHFVC